MAVVYNIVINGVGDVHTLTAVGTYEVHKSSYSVNHHLIIVLPEDNIKKIKSLKSIEMTSCGVYPRFKGHIIYTVHVVLIPT